MNGRPAGATGPAFGPSERPVRTGSLRRRVVLAVLAVLLVVLTGLGLLVNYLLGDRLRADVRQRLTDRAQYAQILDQEGVTGQRLADRLAGQGITSSLRSGDQVIRGRERPDQAGPPGGRPGGRHPPAAPGGPAAVTTSGDLLSTTVSVDGGTLVLQTNQADVGRTLSLLRRIELAAGAGTLLVAGLVLVRVVGIALAPLDRMTRLARCIRDGARGGRLRPTDASTDIGATAAAFDDMLDALEAAERAAQQAETRMRRFLADASHDLRTPIAGMIASAERLLRADPGRAERERRLVDLVREARRSARLVDDLLLMTRLDSTAEVPGSDVARPVDVRALVQDAAAGLRLRQPDLTAEITVPAQAVTVWSPHGDELRRALLNVVDNAAASTPPGGRICLGVTADADRVAIDVRDSGMGVSEADRDRIFDRFVRGDAARTGAGSGLGLPIGRAICRAHRGDLMCLRSDVGGHFRLTFATSRPTGSVPTDRQTGGSRPPQQVT